MFNPKNSLRSVYYAARGLWLRGGRRHCPLCGGSFRRFLPKGDPVRAEAMCPRCLSLERHRLLWLFLAREKILEGRGLSLLHFAPERGIRGRLQSSRSLRYVTLDLSPDRADTAMDATRLGFRSGTFDRVLCCHVLEHVAEDAVAIRELARVLKPGGIAILQIPLREGPTDEDPSVVDPGERLRRFGQEDHLRLYGREDFTARLEAAGFSVESIPYARRVDRDEAERCRLSSGDAAEDWIFMARKPARGAPPERGA